MEVGGGEMTCADQLQHRRNGAAKRFGRAGVVHVDGCFFVDGVIDSANAMRANLAIGYPALIGCRARYRRKVEDVLSIPAAVEDAPDRIVLVEHLGVDEIIVGACGDSIPASRAADGHLIVAAGQGDGVLTGGIGYGDLVVPAGRANRVMATVRIGNSDRAVPEKRVDRVAADRAGKDYVIMIDDGDDAPRNARLIESLIGNRRLISMRSSRQIGFRVGPSAAASEEVRGPAVDMNRRHV